MKGAYARDAGEEDLSEMREAAKGHDNIAELLNTLERRKAKRLELMSKPGSLRIPDKVEEKRIRYGITDNMFKIQATFESGGGRIRYTTTRSSPRS